MSERLGEQLELDLWVEVRLSYRRMMEDRAYFSDRWRLYSHGTRQIYRFEDPRSMDTVIRYRV